MNEELTLQLRILRKGLGILEGHLVKSLEKFTNTLEEMTKDDQVKCEEYVEEQLRHIYNELLVTLGTSKMLTKLFTVYDDQEIQMDQSFLDDLLNKADQEKKKDDPQ